MQGRQHEVSSQGGLNPNICRFFVPHFTNQNDIRISPQKRAHRHGEGKIDFGLHLHLLQTILSDLYRILSGPNLPLRRVELA